MSIIQRDIYMSGDISYDIKNLFDLLKEYLELKRRIEDTIKGEELEKRLKDARNSFEMKAMTYTNQLVNDLKNLQELVKPKTDYCHTQEFDQVINLIKAAGEDKMPIDVLMQFAEKFKDNSASIDLMISTAKNKETKDFFESFKRNRVVCFDDALSAAISIQNSPMRHLENVSSISTLFKRLAAIDDTYKHESERISELFFEIFSAYRHNTYGKIPVR